MKDYGISFIKLYIPLNNNNSSSRMKRRPLIESDEESDPDNLRGTAKKKKQSLKDKKKKEKKGGKKKGSSSESDPIFQTKSKKKTQKTPPKRKINPDKLRNTTPTPTRVDTLAFIQTQGSEEDKRSKIALKKTLWWIDEVEPDPQRDLAPQGYLNLLVLPKGHDSLDEKGVHYDYGRIFSISASEPEIDPGDVVLETDCGWVYLDLWCFSYDLGNLPLAMDAHPQKELSPPYHITTASKKTFIFAITAAIREIWKSGPAQRESRSREPKKLVGKKPQSTILVEVDAAASIPKPASQKKKESFLKSGSTQHVSEEDISTLTASERPTGLAKPPKTLQSASTPSKKGRGRPKGSGKGGRGEAGGSSALGTPSKVGATKSTVAQGVISSLKKYQWNNGTPLLVPIEFCKPPTDSWKCRDRDQSFVKKLVESLKRTPDAIPFMESAATVIFDEEHSKDVETLTAEEVLALIKEKGGYVYHGDHRRQAVFNLHQLYTNNVYFAHLRTMITILPNEEEFKRQLYSVGLAVNLLGELKNPVSWAERIRAMHTHWLRDIKSKDLVADNEYWSTFYPLKSFTPEERNKISPEINLATMDTKIVMKMLDVCQMSSEGKLLGKKNKKNIVTNARAKPIESYSKFSWLAGLDDESRSSLLDLVKDGQLSLESAKHRADHIKKIRWCRKIMLDDIKIETWEEACDKYGVTYLNDCCEMFAPSIWSITQKQIQSGVRPTNWKTFIKELKNSKPSSTHAIQEQIVVKNPWVKSKEITHSFFQLECFFINNLLKNGRYGIWIIDPPYGILNTEWDIVFSDQQWCDLFLKIKTVDSTPDPYIFVFCHMEIAPTILMAAQKTGLYLAQRMSWFKPHTASTGAVPKYQSQVEDVLIFLPTGHKLFFNWAENIPEQGSNVIVYPAMKIHTKDNSGEVLNPAEKPWQVYYRMLRPHFREGNQIVELCSGLSPGARVASLFRCNSFHVDSNEIQVKAGTALLESFINTRFQEMNRNQLMGYCVPSFDLKWPYLPKEEDSDSMRMGSPDDETEDPLEREQTRSNLEHILPKTKTLDAKERCIQCSDPEEIPDIKCSWCQLKIHSRCAEKILGSGDNVVIVCSKHCSSKPDDFEVSSVPIVNPEITLSGNMDIINLNV